MRASAAERHTLGHTHRFLGHKHVHSEVEISRKLGLATSSIGLVSDEPFASANDAAEFLRSRGFDARVVLDAEPELPIAFDVTNAMPGTVLNFRRHVIHLPKPQPAGARSQ